MGKKKLLIPVVLLIAVTGMLFLVLGKSNLLVWGVLLLCPLMHLFGHNHSGHKNSDHSKHHH